MSRLPLVVAVVALLLAVALLLVWKQTGREEPPMRFDALASFAAGYTAAWCSQDPAQVASFYAENGSLRVNDGEPAVGREAITETARGFMTAFPDLVVTMDGLAESAGRVVYRWTLEGTNSGPGGTGNRVRISGYEQWRMTDDGLIAESLGNFDAAEYQRQLEQGID